VRAKVNEGLVYEGVPGIAYTARPAGEQPADEPRGASGGLTWLGLTALGTAAGLVAGHAIATSVL